jgi:hypothetical protein
MQKEEKSNRTTAKKKEIVPRKHNKQTTQKINNMNYNDRNYY